MALPYTSRVQKTSQMCMISRTKTYIVDRISPTPRLKTNSITMGYTASSTVRSEIWDQVTSATKKSATRLKKKLTSAKQHFSSGKMYLGI